MKRTFKNCSECVALKKCFSDDDLANWSKEKNNAETCSKPYRGYGNDMVQVYNSEKCLSLKKAFRLANDGRILWDDFHQARYPEAAKKESANAATSDASANSDCYNIC